MIREGNIVYHYTKVKYIFAEETHSEGCPVSTVGDALMTSAATINYVAGRGHRRMLLSGVINAEIEALQLEWNQERLEASKALLRALGEKQCESCNSGKSTGYIGNTTQ